MTRTLFWMTALPAIFFLAACAVHDPKNPAMRQDPLIDRIIDSRTGTPITFETLIAQISGNDVIYLSEKHNNPSHHQFQHQVIKALIQQDISPVLAFEFFAMAETPVLLNFIDSGKVPHSPKMMAVMETDLRKKLGWDSQPDDLWKFYWELLVLAREKGLQTAGIDLTTSLTRRITRKGLDGLTPIEKDMIFSTSLNNPAYQAYMEDLFKQVHCGMAMPDMQKRLYDTWLARNDTMAQSISRLKQHAKGPVVVIIGGGHTEYGLGVMDRLSELAPNISQTNIALTEILRDPAPLYNYLEPLILDGFGARLPADFLVFSQRVSYKDPCETFKRQLEKMKRAPVN